MKICRPGFSLAELISVSCAFSLFLAILFPAIQQSRSAAQNVKCQSNLQQIGVASLNYEDTIGRFPPFLGLCDNPRNGPEFFDDAFNYPQTYPLVQLLPFVGKQELADMVDPVAFDIEECITIGDAGYATFGGWVNEGLGAIFFDNQVDLFLCPSDDEFMPWEDLLGIMSPSNNGTAATSFFARHEDTKTIRTYTNYTINIGAFAVTDTPNNPDLVGMYGPMRSRASESVVTILDGASNTVLFGESVGYKSPPQIPNARHSAVLGGFGVGRPDLYGHSGGAFGTLEESHWSQFGSAHPDVSNILRADGSVQSVNRNIQLETFGRLCAIADGQPLFDFER